MVTSSPTLMVAGLMVKSKEAGLIAGRVVTGAIVTVPWVAAGVVATFAVATAVVTAAVVLTTAVMVGVITAALGGVGSSPQAASKRPTKNPNNINWAGRRMVFT